MILPEDFTKKMQAMLGDEYLDFLQSLELPSQKAITCNYQRIDKETFETIANFQYSPIAMVDNGFTVENFKIGNHILNHLGVIYSQEPSSMYPVELLDIQQGDIVLDLCSAPGGKSIQILNKLQNTGLLVSNEIVYSRTKILYENLSRMGFTNYAITCNSPKDYMGTNLKFDKILVDAPCGGEGMFRKDNFDFNSYTNSNIETNAKRQLNILESIKNLLKKGGRLVYSTCTYDIRENEEVVAKFLENNRDFKIVEASNYNDVTCKGIKIDPFDTQFCLRRYPHKFAGEGQFMAVLEKIGEEEIYSSEFNATGYKILYRKEIDKLKRQLKGIFDISDYTIANRHDNYYILPKTTLNFENLNLVSIGVLLGTTNKDIFKLSHNFYHSMGNQLPITYNLNDDEIIPYLQGQELSVENNTSGICGVLYKNIPLGGGKIVNNKLKNYYPKELRIK